MFFDFSKEGRWASKFQAKYPYVDRARPAEGLRLILGVGRSGTSWVSKVLSKTVEPTRFFSEPLFHLHPRLPFQAEKDHTAIGYGDTRKAEPLLAAYQLVAHHQFDGSGLTGWERNDAGWRICLVKEVHALLGTEMLLRAWQSPVIFILRDPVYVIDSLFSAQTLETPYLVHEVAAIQQASFLNRFANGKQEAVRQTLADNTQAPTRRRILVERLICTQLLQQMFTILAKEFPCAQALAYEEFCERPLETYQLAARAVGIPWDESMSAYLQQSMRGDAVSSADAYSVLRNTSSQKNREFKFLSIEEISLCRAILEAVAL